MIADLVATIGTTASVTRRTGATTLNDIGQKSRADATVYTGLPALREAPRGGRQLAGPPGAEVVEYTMTLCPGDDGVLPDIHAGDTIVAYGQSHKVIVVDTADYGSAHVECGVRIVRQSAQG